MDWANVLGAIGSLCTIGSFVPQAWKAFWTGETRALSLPTYLLTVTGFALWTAYGALLGALPLIVTNGICFVTSGFILVMKLRSDQTEPAAESR